MRGVDEARRLVAEHPFRQVPVEERVLDVELVDRPVSCRGEMQHGPNGGRLDHRGEGLVEVQARALGEATHDPARFPAFQPAISMKLVFEDPFPSDDRSARGSRYKLPSAIVLERLELLLHRREPFWITKRSTNRAWDSVDFRNVGVAWVRLDHAGLASRNHGVSHGLGYWWRHVGDERRSR